jgi:hypothetical protein
MLLATAVYEQRRVIHTGRFGDFLLFNSWWVVLSIPWLCHIPAAQKQPGIKMCEAVKLNAVIVVGVRKNAKMYTIERAKKMSIDK